MKTAIIANALLLFSLGLLFTAPAVGCPLTALLVYTSKRNRKLGRLWLRYYKEIINSSTNGRTKSNKRL